MDAGDIKIIHSGSLQLGIIPSEARRFNDCQFELQAGAEPGNRASVGGDVWLVECNFNHRSNGLARFVNDCERLLICDIL